MAETITELTVINRALARIGEARVFDLEDESDLVSSVVAVHEDLIEAAIELYDWYWPRRTVSLEALADKPFGYSGSFAFPATAIGPPVALYASDSRRADPLRDFRVDGRTVAADTTVLWGRFRMRLDPAEWPAAFRMGYTIWLASALAIPVSQDANLKQLLEEEALGTPSEGGRGGIIGRAIAFDASHSGGPAPLSTTDPLTDAHGGGRYNGW